MRHCIPLLTSPVLHRLFRSAPRKTIVCSALAQSTMPVPQYALLAVGGMSGAIVAALYAFQEKLLYHPTIPTREYEAAPQDLAMPYRDVDIVADDGVKLHGWLITQARASREAATFVYFHGNAGNIGHRLQDARRFYARGYNLLMVSYRGYGRSEGAPNEPGLMRDAAAAIAYAADRADVIDTRRVYLFGRSIGGAVAIAAAAAARANTVRGLVIENSFTSIDDMIDVVLPPLRAFKFLNRNKWDSLSRIKDVKVPILFISGQRDELCPPIHMRRLHEEAENSPIREFHTVANGTHNVSYCTCFDNRANRLRLLLLTILTIRLSFPRRTLGGMEGARIVTRLTRL